MRGEICLASDFSAIYSAQDLDFPFHEIFAKQSIYINFAYGLVCIYKVLRWVRLAERNIRGIQTNQRWVEKETRAELAIIVKRGLQHRCCLLCCIPVVRKVLDFAKEPKTNQGIIAKALRNPNYLP